MASEDIVSQTPPPPDARISYGEYPNQFVELRTPPGKGAHPVATVIHGGFWRAKYDLVHAGHLCAALRDAGIAPLNVEYRRVGNPGGGWPGSLQDIEAALTFISNAAQKYRLDLRRVIVIG